MLPPPKTLNQDLLFIEKTNFKNPLNPNSLQPQNHPYRPIPKIRVPIRNTADYSPFGVQLDGRTVSGDFYRRGFNGMEKDDEVKGGGNSYTAEFWQYDSRAARRWNLDPVFKDHESPYACFANNPIAFVDKYGADTSFADNKTKEQFDKVYDNLKTSIEINIAKIDLLKMETANSKNSVYNSKVENDILSIENETLKLTELKSNLDNVINSINLFHYTSNANPNNLIVSGGGTSWNETNKRYEINFYEGNGHTIIHETTHCNQFLDGRIKWNAFPDYSYCNYDYQDEVEGYIDGDYYREKFNGIPKRDIQVIQKNIERFYGTKDHIIKEFKQYKE